MSRGEDDVAQNARDPDRRQAPVPWHAFPAIFAPGGHHVALHVGMRDRNAADHRRHQPLRSDQPREGARREGAAAEAEHVDLVSGLPVPADESVELADVGRHADAGGAVERGEWLPARGADALDVVRDLIGLGAVERLVEPPHVGFLGGEGVAGAVGEQHEFSRRSRRAAVAAGERLIVRRVRLDRRFHVGL